MEDIYKLQIHESCNIAPDIGVTKVPEGWIYRFWNYEKDQYENVGTFVPYSEFLKND